MNRQRITLFSLLLFTVLLFVPLTVNADDDDVIFQDYHYGDPYLAVEYLGDGENPNIFAFEGTGGLPGPKTKVYNAKYTSSADEYRINIPVQWKIGTTFTIRCVSWNSEYESYNINVLTGKVLRPYDVEYHYNYITSSSKNVKIKVWNVHKGDRIKIKIGKKTYTKKISKNYSKKTFKVKIKKAKAGSKMTVWIVNKYNQSLVGKDKCKVYKYNKVKLGMTKKQVKATADWATPKKKNYSAYSEQWCYDFNGDGRYDAWLYFNNSGTVSNWQKNG